MEREAFRQFCKDYDVAVCVMSRDRADSLAKRTDTMASDYHLYWSGDGYDQHEYRCLDRHEVDRGIESRPKVANYVCRDRNENIVILLDDDISGVDWLGEDKLYPIDDAGFRDMLCNLTINALDVKARLFGINDVDIRKSSPLIPFHTRAMVGALVGVIGRGIWHDERQRVKADYDFVLQHLKRDRLVWKDLRYFLRQNRNTLPGGNMPFRTAEREELEVQNLRDWWGDDIIRWKPSGKKGQVSKSLGVILGNT